MTKSRKDCLDDLAKKTGRTKKEVDDLLDEIDARAGQYQHDGLGPDESYAKARDEMLKEIGERAALARRSEIMDMRKEIARHRYYGDAARQIADLAPKLAAKAEALALEAKLVGINVPSYKGRFSVDAQFVALRRLWVGGFSHDLEEAGLLKVFASHAIEDKWTAELFELNKGNSGNPGVTKDSQALAIAKTIQKWQKVSIDALNGEGAWVRSYSGYITRTSHSAEKILAAGPEKWVADTIGKLDLKRTFGTTDRARALDALREMWTPMKNGDHFDYGRALDEPLHASLAKKVSEHRELHFKSGADWRAYNEAYGVHNPTRQVVEALTIAARRTALMKEFGTSPREAFERDINFTKATMQAESKAQTARIGALEEALASPALDPERKATIEKELASLRERIETSADNFGTFEKFVGKQDSFFGSPAFNRFAQIDGSAQRPINRTAASLTANWMAIQRMAKLGRVALTHFASLPTKSMEAAYWGIPVAERFGSLFRGLTRGLEGSAKREALDATLVAFENRLGHMMSLYDVADAPAGYLAKAETTFFKLTGVSMVIDNQRGDAEAMFASHIGGKRGQDWAGIGRKEQRVLQGFGIGEPEWKALHGVEWSQFGERTYLTPQDAMKLSDEQVAAYLKEAKSRELGPTEPNATAIAKGREDLALQLAAAYSDRAGYAIPMPNARIRAILFQKAFEPGSGLNTALRLVYQFKIWPADMITRAWGREMYGRIGDGRLDRVSGLVEAAVGAIIFGVASEGVRELIQGKNPIVEMQHSPIGSILKGAQRSGFGSLIGDFLLGEFDRHGFSAVGSLAGPTFSQIDVLMDLLHAGGRTKEGMLSKTAMRERGADLIKLAHDNLPFMNLWATGLAFDTLVWHRLQEWINPGYLKRREQRMQQQQGTHYWLSPANTDQWITGRRASPL